MEDKKEKEDGGDLPMPNKNEFFLSVERGDTEHPMVEIHERDFQVNNKEKWKYCLRELLEVFNHIARLRGWDLQKILENTFEKIRENRRDYRTKMNSIMGLPKYDITLDDFKS